MEEKKCAFCGAVLNEESEYCLDDTFMCKDCYQEQTTTCEDCGERIWCDDAEGGNSRILCYSCYDNYTHCDNCGRLIHNSDAYYYSDSDVPYCCECYDEDEDDDEENEIIQNYNYKPEPIFYGSGSLFLGVELGLDKGGEYDNNAQQLLDIANRTDETLYVKHDGSIDYGFELVSHPMDLEYHTNSMAWKDIFKRAVEMGYRSHQTSTCGLHVHVNRSAFGESEDEREEVIARIVYFVEAHWNELLKFSRRTESSINRWASRYGLKDGTKQTYDGAKDKNLGRYACVNLQNYFTIEFRIFRGTLRYETFLATLQLVDEICHKAINLSHNQFESMTWNEFVSNISKEKKELIDYLKLKQLYVNEPIVAESEDM